MHGLLRHRCLLRSRAARSRRQGRILQREPDRKRPRRLQHAPPRLPDRPARQDGRKTSGLHDRKTWFALLSGTRFIARTIAASSGRGDIALQFGKGLDTDPAWIACKAETFAASEDVAPNWSRRLWKLAARAHKDLDNPQDHVRCQESAAESYVKIGDAAGGRGDEGRRRLRERHPGAQASPQHQRKATGDREKSFGMRSARCATK